MTPAATSITAQTPDHSAAGSSAPSKAEIITRFGTRKPMAWGLNLPGEITHISAANHGVALTFDACGGRGGSGYDEALITLLRRNGVKATLMLNTRWIGENRTVAKELAADPLFQIGNHGVTHRPLSVTPRTAYRIAGTGSLSALYDEVRGAHDWIASVQPDTRPFFRSGTAYSDDVGVAVCDAMGAPFAGYSLNADAGATFDVAQITAAMMTVKAGDIVIGHMNHPERSTAKGFAAVLPRLLDAGVTFHHFS